MVEKKDTIEHWDIIIHPGKSFFELGLKKVWQYRDLLVLLVRRDFVSFYKQTILGPLWFFIQPVFTTIMFTFVFNRLAGITTGDVPAPLFYMAGITMWNYFSDCLLKTSTVFKDNANVFGKVYFPRLIMPMSIVISNLVRFGVQFLLFLAVMLVFYFKGANFHITTYVLLFPVMIIQLALLGLGTGMIVSALTTKYRDLSFVVTFGVQLLMYATTVIYPLSAAPAKYKWIIAANPVTPIIETFRLGFLGQGTFSWSLFAYSLGVTCAITLAGIFIFNRVEKDFIDTV